MSLLHPGLPKEDYQVTSSLKEVGEWKARILVGNSMPEGQEVGEWDEVGYVMVALSGEPRVVPIARCDEHERGYDLLFTRAKKWGLKAREFFPIFHGGSTGIYVYDRKEVPRALEATRRWLAAGGPDFPIRYTGGEPEDRWVIGARDFVAGNGKAVPMPDGLLPVGHRLVQTFRTLSEAVAGLRHPERPWELREDRRGQRKVETAAKALVRLVSEDRNLAGHALYDMAGGGFQGGSLDTALASWSAAVDTHLAKGDMAGIERLVFGHGGIKNRLHMQIREELARRPLDMGPIFGNLELADAAMASISPGLTAAEAEDALANSRPR